VGGRGALNTNHGRLHERGRGHCPGAGEHDGWTDFLCTLHASPAPSLPGGGEREGGTWHGGVGDGAARHPPAGVGRLQVRAGGRGWQGQTPARQLQHQHEAQARHARPRLAPLASLHAAMKVRFGHSAMVWFAPARPPATGRLPPGRPSTYRPPLPADRGRACAVPRCAGGQQVVATYRVADLAGSLSQHPLDTAR
jgi:hypothetical protein